MLTDPMLGFGIGSRVRYDFALKFIKDKRVLDLGCGNGGGADLMIKAGAKKVVGIDHSKDTVREAGKRYSNKQIEFVWMRVEDLRELKGKFEVVTGFEIIEHLDEKQQQELVRQMKRLLVSGGLVVLSTPNREWLEKRGEKKNVFHKKELSEAEIRKLFKGFSKVNVYGLRCVNKGHKKAEKKLHQRWQNKLIDKVMRFRWMYRAVRWIPEGWRRGFDKTDAIKELSLKDFEIKKTGVRQSEGLVVVASL